MEAPPSSSRVDLPLDRDPVAIDLALAVTGVGVFDYDVAADRYRLSTRTREIWGLPAGEEPSFGRLYASIHPDDRVLVIAALASLSPAASEFDVEHRILRPDGSTRWLAVRGRAAWSDDAAPRIVRRVGTMLDVTERREAQRARDATERLVRRITDVVPAVVYVHDVVAGRNVYANAEVATLVGHRAADLAAWGERVMDVLMHPEDRARLPAHLDRLARLPDGESLEIEYRMRHADGGWRWFHARDAVYSRGADGAVREVVGCAVDVTDRRRAEEILRRNAETFHQLIDRAPFGTYVVDADLRIHQVSRGAEAAFRHLHPAIGRDFAEVMHTLWPDTLARHVVERFRHTLATGEPYAEPGRVVARTEDGGVDEYDWRIERIGLPDGRHGVVCWFYDLSERRRLEQRLRESERRLLDADRRKDEFLATLAHELRNPLAPIRTAAQLLASPALAPPQLQWAQGLIQRQVGHMALLLDDLLDVARITRGRLALKRERTTLAAVVDAAVEAARPLLDARSHRLSVSLPARGVALDADPLRLAQVLSNLLANAAKYTDPGGHVAIDARLDGGRLRLAVRDDGIGIPADTLERIFGIFSQGEGAAQRAEGGLGIGLALVRGLVELHGGRVEARSDGPGRGAEFVVELPVAAAEPAAAPVATDASHDAGAGRRVLVVDDNRDAADALGLLLSLSGHEVRVAHGGRAALSLAPAFRPEVVLLDLGMPDVDGYAVARALRTAPGDGTPLLVALTGWGQEEDKRRAREAGCDWHFTKPVDPDALLRLLRERTAPAPPAAAAAAAGPPTARR